MVALLLVAATLCLAIATLFLFGVASVSHPQGWLALGLTLWCAAVLIGAAAPMVNRGQ